MALKRGQDNFGWFKFYPSKWTGDMDLMSVSLAAQGLWMQMCCVMFVESVPRGVLRDDLKDLARRLRLPLETVKPLVKELEKCNVFSRGEVVIAEYGDRVGEHIEETDIVCRMMFREWREKFLKSKAGRAGGLRSAAARSTAEKDGGSKRKRHGKQGSSRKSVVSGSADGELQSNAGSTPASNIQAPLSKESRDQKEDRSKHQTKIIPHREIPREGGPVVEAGAVVGEVAAGVVAGTVDEANAQFRGWVALQVVNACGWSEAAQGWWAEVLGRMPRRGLDVVVEACEYVAKCGSGRGDLAPLRNPQGYVLEQVYAWARGAGYPLASCPR